MASYFNIMIIMMTISVGLMFFGFNNGISVTAKMFTLNVSSGSVSSGDDAPLASFINLLLAGLTIGGLSAVSVWFIDKSQVAYAGFAGFLFGFAFFPITLFTMDEMPVMAKFVIGIPLVTAFILSIVNWFRGVSD